MAGDPRIVPWRRAWFLMACLVGFVGAAGCGPAGPDVQMIRGVVILDGQPVRGATVIFAPEADGLMAAGKTNSDGVFALNASQGKKFGRGTTIGDYIVTVNKLTAYRIDAVTGEPTTTLLPEPQQLMPRVYTTVDHSPLRASVTKGINVFQFELSSKLKK